MLLTDTSKPTVDHLARRGPGDATGTDDQGPPVVKLLVQGIMQQRFTRRVVVMGEKLLHSGNDGLVIFLQIDTLFPDIRERCLR